jgi:hypothetical protein
MESIYKIFYNVLIWKNVVKRHRNNNEEYIVQEIDKIIGPFKTYEAAEKYADALPEQYSYNIEWNAEAVKEIEE